MADCPWWDTILPAELVDLRRRLLKELGSEFGEGRGVELEDIVQQAFVVLFLRRESVKADEDGLYRYLKTVASNAAVDRIRTDLRRQQRLSDLISGRKYYESRRPNPETQPSGKEEESERIRRVFCALGDLDRLMLWSYAVEGRSIRAIARSLDLNWHRVAQTIERALRRIRSELGEVAV